MIVLEKILMLFYPAMPFVRACGSGERGRVVRGLREAAAGYSLMRFACMQERAGLHGIAVNAQQITEPVPVICGSSSSKRDETCETAYKVNAAGDR